MLNPEAPFGGTGRGELQKVEEPEISVEVGHCARLVGVEAGRQILDVDRFGQKADGSAGQSRPEDLGRGSAGHHDDFEVGAKVSCPEKELHTVDARKHDICQEKLIP